MILFISCKQLILPFLTIFIFLGRLTARFVPRKVERITSPYSNIISAQACRKVWTPPNCSVGLQVSSFPSNFFVLTATPVGLFICNLKIFKGSYILLSYAYWKLGLVVSHMKQIPSHSWSLSVELALMAGGFDRDTVTCVLCSGEWMICTLCSVW